MKSTLFILSLLAVHSISAKEIRVFDDKFMKQVNEDYKAVAVENENQLINLEKTIAYMQRNYEAKVNFLEVELTKTKDRLVEKSINEEKIQQSIRNDYEDQISSLRKELAMKNRSILELQRMVEKIKPNEDTKNLIKLNNELASELRKNEGQVAALQLELRRSINTTHVEGGNRKPASVEEK